MILLGRAEGQTTGASLSTGQLWVPLLLQGKDKSRVLKEQHQKYLTTNSTTIHHNQRSATTNKTKGTITKVCYTFGLGTHQHINSGLNNQLKELRYRALQMTWQEEYSAVEGFHITNDITSARVTHQFMSHGQAVNLWSEVHRVLKDARCFTLHGNVVADNIHTRNIA